jgi:hypothetical protein
MPRTKGRRDNKAQGIGTKRRGEGSFNKEGINRVTNIKGMHFNIKGRCFNTDRKIRLINRT